MTCIFGDHCQGDKVFVGQVQRVEIVQILGIGSSGSTSHFVIYTRQCSADGRYLLIDSSPEITTRHSAEHSSWGILLIFTFYRWRKCRRKCSESVAVE